MSYTATLRVWRGDAGAGELTDYQVEANDGDVVLDVLHRLQATQAGDLAIRWNCKAGKCGSCSMEINGRPRLACMTRPPDQHPRHHDPGRRCHRSRVRPQPPVRHPPPSQPPGQAPRQPARVPHRRNGRGTRPGRPRSATRSASDHRVGPDAAPAIRPRRSAGRLLASRSPDCPGICGEGPGKAATAGPRVLTEMQPGRQSRRSALVVGQGRARVHGTPGASGSASTIRGQRR
jgi:ferredoxin